METPKRTMVWQIPALFGLIVGMLAGPMVAGYFGWMMLPSTAKQQLDAAVYAQEAQACAMMARAAVPDAYKLHYGKRHDVAEKYANLPWNESTNYRVADLCADALAEEPTQAKADSHQG